MRILKVVGLYPKRMSIMVSRFYSITVWIGFLCFFPNGSSFIIVLLLPIVF